MLAGGSGSDTLTGGEGVDTFVYTGTDLGEASDALIFDQITDFTAGVGGDVINLSSLHSSNTDSLSSDASWAATEFAYAHGYIQFIQSGSDTLVQYDRDGWSSNNIGKTIAVLEGVTAAEVLPGTNSTPALSDKLFYIESLGSLNEDSSDLLTYRIVLGQAPTAPVTVNIEGGAQIVVNGSSASTQIVFTADNWWIPQTLEVQAVDDLIIEGNVAAPLQHSFSSADGAFEGLSESLSVSVIDNDFQLTLEPSKVPSDGNNAILYDTLRKTNTSSSYSRYNVGLGNDRIQLSAEMQADVAGYLFQGDAGDDTLLGVTLASGGTGNDYIEAALSGPQSSYGSFSYHEYARLSGGTGNDTLIGGDNDDALVGGRGDDSLTGGDGDDYLAGDLTDNVSHGSNSQGYINYSSGLWRPSADISTVEAGNDTLRGGLGDDQLYGHGGDDLLYGEGDNDQLYGGDGLDQLYGGTGDDQLYGGNEIDQLYGGEGGDQLDGDDGDDYLEGQAGDDSLSGGAGDDRLLGGLGADTLDGDAGNDRLEGGADDDTLSGGDGDDLLYGNDGDDLLNGSVGFNIFTGGAGVDTFQFTYAGFLNSTNVITDFTAGSGGDLLDLSNIHQASIDLGYSAWPAEELPFSHGYFRMVQSNEDLIIGYDRDGHHSNHFFEPIVTLLNTNGTEISPDNFTFGQQNFDILDTGFSVNQIFRADGTGYLEVNLWGGVPTTDVTIIARTTQGSDVGSVTFTPVDWQGVKQIELGIIDSGFDAGQDLTYQMNSTDIDYSAGGLVSYVIDDTLVLQKPSIVQPELSIVSAETNNAFNVDYNQIPSAMVTTPVRLVSTTDNGLVVNGTLTINGTESKIELEDSNLSGVYAFNGTAVVEGEVLTFNSEVNFDNPNGFSVKAEDSIVDESAQQVSFTVQLDKIAGEELTLGWAVSGIGANPVSAEDFAGALLPSGTLSFARGEQEKTLTLNIADDLLIEDSEAFELSLNAASGSFNHSSSKTSIVIKDNDTPAMSGTLSYWNGESIDLSLALTRSQIPLSDSGASGFKNIRFDRATETLSLDFFASPAEIGQNFDFQFSVDPSVSVQVDQSDASASWLLLDGRNNSEYSLAGVTTIPLTGLDPVLMFSMEFIGVSKLSMPSFGGGTLNDASVLPDEIYQVGTITSENGGLAFDGEQGLFELSDESVYASDYDLSISSKDALLALQIANGSLTSEDLYDPLQISAADANQNGEVTTLDAWLLLKQIVEGSGDSSIGTLHFVEDGTDLSGVSATNTSVPEYGYLDSLLDSSPNLTAFIVGDVDGSYWII